MASDLALACLTNQLAKDPNANQLHSSSSSLGVRHPQNKITCLASASLALTVRERPNVQACLYTKQPNASLQVEEGLSWVLANYPNNPNVTMALQHKIRTEVLFSKNENCEARQGSPKVPKIALSLLLSSAATKPFISVQIVCRTLFHEFYYFRYVSLKHHHQVHFHRSSTTIGSMYVGRPKVFFYCPRHQI